MSGGDDERPRRSWREIDRMRDGSGHRPEERKPRGKAAEALSRQATQTYLKQIDGLFAQDGGGAESERLPAYYAIGIGSPDDVADALKFAGS